MAKKTTAAVVATACTSLAVLAKKNVGFTDYALGCGLFRDINFADLDASITALGEQGAIEKEDRKNAVEVVDQWRSNVQNRLRSHYGDVNTIIGILTGDNLCPLFDEENRNRIAGLVSTLSKKEQDPWTDLVAKIQIADEARKALVAARRELDDSNHENPDESPAERILRRSDVKRDYVLAEVQSSRANYQCRLVYKAFVATVGKHEIVKQLIAQSEPYLRNLNRLETIASEKAQDAKINISIGNKAVREALKAMQGWSKGV